jgi:hypothetical protein
MRFVVVLDRNLVRAAEPSAKIDQFAALGTEGRIRLLAGLGFLDRFFADRSQHGGTARFSAPVISSGSRPE